MRKYTARMMFIKFRKEYPELWRRGTTYQLWAFSTILIKIPTVGILTYMTDQRGDEIKWIERWEDPIETKRQRDEKRSKDYTYFTFKVQERMEQLGLSQGDVSDITGISRQSINAYLSGKKIPKLSTMERITEALDIYDF